MDPSNQTIPLRILHLEDSLLDHELTARALSRTPLKFALTRVDTQEAFYSLLEQGHFDVVLADYHLPGFTAADVWLNGPERLKTIPFILLSGAIGETAAVAAIQLGMSDYLLKEDIGRLERVILRAIEVQEARQAREKAMVELAQSEQRLAEFSSHLQAMIEQERAAIAREIHDDIGGSLAAIRFDLSWLGRHLKEPGALEHIRMADDMLQHAIGASQRIMMNLRPAILDQGLEAAVDWLAGEFEKRTHINTTFRSALTQSDTAKNIELAAYRTAQEALTNISKYANCSQVTIELSDSKEFLTLEINDNGRGISAAEFDKPQSFGIKGLRERARSIGGWLDVSTREGQGTSVIFSVPIGSLPATFSLDALP
jgi:signal transduction histidine kinase